MNEILPNAPFPSMNERLAFINDRFNGVSLKEEETLDNVVTREQEGLHKYIKELQIILNQRQKKAEQLFDNIVKEVAQVNPYEAAEDIEPAFQRRLRELRETHAEFAKNLETLNRQIAEQLSRNKELQQHNTQLQQQLNRLEGEGSSHRYAKQFDQLSAQFGTHIQQSFNK